MDFAQQQKSSTSRLTGIGVVVALHAALIYALVTGLAHKAIQVLPAPVETKILEDTTVQEEPPPPPPPPDLDVPPPPFIPPPEIQIQQPVQRQQTITQVTTERPPPTPPAPPAPKPVQRVAPVVKAANCRKPDYPAISERLGETGTVVLQLLVGTDGKVTDSRIEKSSGYPRLDEAAVRGLSACRFAPGTVDGRPAPAWARIQYTFKRAQ